MASLKLRSFFGGRENRASSEEIKDPLLDLSDPPLTPLALHGYSTTTKNKILTADIGEEVRNILPARLQISPDWELLYSMEQHGASLSTLYRLIKPEGRQYDRNGYVLAVKDRKGTVFGAFVNEFFHPTDTHRFYGNGQCFLWKSKQAVGEERLFQGFPYTGLNDYIIYCTSEFLSLGGGDGHYGLWMDRDLLTGVSDRSLTFGNEGLSEEGEKFGIIGVEIWKVG